MDVVVGRARFVGVTTEVTCSEADKTRTPQTKAKRQGAHSTRPCALDARLPTASEMASAATADR